ncbi:MAG: MarR family winged helix-turn-helix transcriptional regulator [Bacillota bacterium]|nr:MarR family winged helix-turn-helix transcriptional regulator [Bacillota bacterium]
MVVSEFKNIVWNYARKISEITNCVFCPVFEEYGLTIVQVRILVELSQCGSHTIGSLANNTCMAGANISAMCKKLEKMELLKRIRDREDERIVKVALTDKGYQIVADLDRTLNNKFSEQIEDTDEETLNEIIIGLEKLNRLIEKIH